MHPLERRVLLPEDLKPITSLDDYKKQGGLKGLEKARTMSSEAIIEEVKNSGLRGRGGAGFPAAIKWQTVHENPEATKYVVCNFAEGEPGTYKDRYLVSKNPYLVFEGMLIVAQAVSAKETIIATKTKFKPTVERLKKAIAEIEEASLCKKGYIRLVLGPDEYLFGEEKALLEVIDGREAMPRLFPPYMVGVAITPTENNPAVVNNFETMSHVAQILANGADNFKQNGTEDTPGTGIISLSGDVKKPGMYEVSFGLTIREMLYELGGGPASEHAFKAIFSGVSNRVLTPDQFDLVMDFGTLRAAGVGFGSGGFMVYDESRSMVQVAWMFSHFLAKSSCGQCIPCNMGTRDITEHLARLNEGQGTQNDVDEILAISSRCTNQARCFLPVQESILVPSLIEKFEDEFKNTTGNGKYKRDIIIPKLESFDELQGQFAYEKNPKEFA